MPGRPLVGCFADSFNHKKASVRLRLLAPMREVSGRGWRLEQVDPDRLTDYDALWFSKSFSRQAIAISRKAQEAGIPILVDVCDNIFEHARRRFDFPKLGRVREQLSAASLVTVSTQVLAEQLDAEMPGLMPKIVIVADMTEDLDACLPDARESRQLARLERFIARHPDALHCVWFGKSSGLKAGLAHLTQAMDRLADFSRTHPTTLTVISDTQIGYRLASARWPIPHHYMPWSIGSIGQALKMHEIAVLPVRSNSYTICKTINRPATALLAGLGVIADAIPAYEELRPYIWLDDWVGGLSAYATGRDSEAPRIAAAREHLKAAYCPESITDRWSGVLDRITSPAFSAA